MTTRDELAQLLANHESMGCGCCAYGPTTPEQSKAADALEISDYMVVLADAILAAGYRKPRTVTTEAELDALPFESVIRDGDECVLERWGDLEESGWVTVMVNRFIPRDQITLPATVLHEGTKP